MNWLPVFEIGFWNAWIPMLIWLSHPLIMIAVDKAVGTGDIFKKMGAPPAEKSEKRRNAIFTVLQLTLLAYSIFLPLKLGTGWFYAGLLIYLAGLVILLTAMLNAAAAPPGTPFAQGIYRYSRHPMYLSISMMFVGVGVASASWLFLLLSLALFNLQVVQASAEEQDCLKTYGDQYQEYMNRTPRWLGLPKIK